MGQSRNSKYLGLKALWNKHILSQEREAEEPVTAREGIYVPQNGSEEINKAKVPQGFTYVWESIIHWKIIKYGRVMETRKVQGRS